MSAAAVRVTVKCSEKCTLKTNVAALMHQFKIRRARRVIKTDEHHIKCVMKKSIKNARAIEMPTRETRMQPTAINV